jgi:16S rRNA (guanine1207-N2)-methyltransferase
MVVSRLTLAIQDGDVVLPESGRIAVFYPDAETDLSSLPKDRAHIIQSFYPDHAAFEQQGYDCAVAPEGVYAASIVFLPRYKALARSLIWQASTMSDVVLVDGLKTDGAESLLRECRKRADVQGWFSKAHGKLFWMAGGADFEDWRDDALHEIEEGFVTRAGVFSADGIDPASRLLADNLPAKLGRQVADLGAGWGYLSKAILKNEVVENLWAVEANFDALECARVNVTDERANFQWADACAWEPRARMDSVVMNPPFHTSRTSDPDIGRAFIAAAARMLTPSGQLWMVANRHLPYEVALDQHFAKFEEVAGDSRFKVLRAQRPTRKRR